jgi:hypothetical protein
VNREEYLKDRLEKIGNVIARVEEGGQEVQYNGRKIRMADLSLLYTQQKNLQDELDSIVGINGRNGRVGVPVWAMR